MKGSVGEMMSHVIPFIVLTAVVCAACSSLPISAVPTADVPHASADKHTISAAAPPGKPLFVEFYTTWCEPCRQMEPTIAKLEGVYGNRVNFLLLDAAGATQEKIKYRYVSQPQIVLVDRQGKIVDTIYGLQGYDGLKAQVDKLLTMP